MSSDWISCPKNTGAQTSVAQSFCHRFLRDHKFVAATLTTSMSVDNCFKIQLPLTRPDPAERSTVEPVNQTVNELLYTSHLSSTFQPEAFLQMGVNPTGSGFTTRNYYSVKCRSVANENGSDSMLECKMSVSIVPNTQE